MRPTKRKSPTLAYLPQIMSLLQRHLLRSGAFNMTETIFDAVKDSVTLSDAAKAYGLSPNRAGFILCPFHQEKTPSMKLYLTSFYCFGCGAHGSVVDFASKLFGLSPLEAVKKLNSDFQLNLPIDRPPDHEDQGERCKILKAQESFTEWREAALYLLCEFVRMANLADYDDPSDAEVFAIHYKELMEEWISALENKNLDVQMEVFRDRKGVAKVCRRILRSTPTRS